jgi:hypothetical protein
MKKPKTKSTQGKLSQSEAERLLGASSGTLSPVKEFKLLPFEVDDIKSVTTHLYRRKDIEILNDHFRREGKFTATCLTSNIVFDTIGELSNQIATLEAEMLEIRAKLEQILGHSVAPIEGINALTTEIESKKIEIELLNKESAQQIELERVEFQKKLKLEEAEIEKLSLELKRLQELIEKPASAKVLPWSDPVTQDLHDPNISPKAFWWFAEFIDDMDIQDELESRFGASLNVYQAVELLGLPQETFIKLLKKKRVRRYRAGFHPSDIVKLGWELGGVQLTFWFKTVEYCNHEGYNEKERIDRAVSIDGIFMESDSVCGSESEQKFLYGDTIVSEIAQYLRIKFGDVERQLNEILSKVR